MLKKKPHRFIVWYLRANFTFLPAFFNLDQKIKMENMGLIRQKIKFDKDLMKECKWESKCFQDYLYSPTKFTCTLPSSPLPTRSLASTSNIYLKSHIFCSIYIHTIIICNFLFKGWCGWIWLVFVYVNFYKIESHNVDVLL